MEQIHRSQPSPENSHDAPAAHAEHLPSIGAFAAPNPAAVHHPPSPPVVPASAPAAITPALPGTSHQVAAQTLTPPPAPAQPTPTLSQPTPAPAPALPVPEAMPAPATMPAAATMVPTAANASATNRPRRGFLLAGMAAMTVAAVGGGAFLITRDSADSVIVDDATELATDSNIDSTAAYSFAAATATAQAAASVVFDMEIDSPEGPMSATASFDRASGLTEMEIDMSQLTAEDDFFDVGDSLSFIVDEPNQVAYVNSDFFAALFGPTDAGWISLTGDEFTVDDDVFGDVLTNPLNIAEVFGDVDPIDLGEETIDGEVLRHFEVVLDAESIADLGDDGLVTEELAQAEFGLTYDVWVDESSQIRRILFDAVDDGEVGSVDMWITVSTDSIEIPVPAAGDVVDLEELFGAAFEDFEIDLEED